MCRAVTDAKEDKTDLVESLIWQYDMGADEAIAEQPTDYFKLARTKTVPTAPPLQQPKVF